MERLEKALQKARRQRAHLVDQPRLVPVGEPGFGENAVPVKPADVTYTETRRMRVSDRVLDKWRIVARRTRRSEADIFRMLRTKVVQQMSQAGMNTLAISSPRYGEGKTTIAINLALSLAMDENHTVLLVDLDLRKPSLHTRLGLNPDAGINDFLLRGTPVQSCLVHPGFERIVVLPASRPLDRSSEILAAPRMVALVEELKTRYPDRMVIYDMPPLLTQDDTIAFLPHVDGVLLVVKEGETPREDMRRAVNLLGDSLLGTVINHSTEHNFDESTR